MNYKSKLFILGLISQIYAAKFSVVSFNGACQLNAGGQILEMKQENPAVPLYSVEANVPSGTTYNYICGGQADVERTLQGETTHNELVGRPITDYDMPEFGFPNAKPWTRSIGRTSLFDPRYVPIVIIDGADGDYITGAKSSTTFGSMTFILKDEFFTFNNVPATGKNYDEDKFQIRVTLPDGGIYHRDVLKFRPSSYDPVFFRQMLYGDIAHAIGNPAHESVAARVYLRDGTGIGLYVLQEDCTTESFIRTAFYGKEDGSVDPVPDGPIYDCSTGADFDYHTQNYLGGFQSSKGVADMKTELLEMTQHIDELNIMDVEAIKNIDENWLELDTLFRALALEYLAGHWDSYWFMTTNFVVYHPPNETEGPDYGHTKYKFYFIDQDFDQTWGSNMKPTINAATYPTKFYTDYINQPAQFWLDMNADEVNSDGVLLEPGTRVILNKFIGCDGQPECETKKYFESHLKNIVQHIFNPVAIRRKAEGYKGRLSDEVQWDTNLTRLHVSTNGKFHFTYDDFVKNIDQPTGAFPYGIVDWTEKMANLVCEHFGMEYDSVPLTPETAAKMQAQKIEAGAEYDKDNLSGSFMNTVNVAMLTIATILSVVLLF